MTDNIQVSINSDCCWMPATKVFFSTLPLEQVSNKSCSFEIICFLVKGRMIGVVFHCSITVNQRLLKRYTPDRWVKD